MPALPPPPAAARSAADGRPATCTAGIGALRSASRNSSPGAALLLPGHARQALDERAELVLAEQPHDLVAVVVAQSRRFKVELDGHVAREP